MVGLDFAFVVQPTAAPGHATFQFVNEGKVRHEYNMVLLKSGITLDQYMSAEKNKVPLSTLVDGTIGVLFANPGTLSSSTLSTELLAGRTYAIRCIFPDSATGRKHEELGMFGQIVVKEGAARPAPPMVFDTIVGTDYAFRFPPTLTPGIHHFVFVNNGKQRHEFGVELLKAGETLKHYREVDNKGGDVEKLISESLGLLHSPAGTTPPATLDINILPGREYVIECGFKDTDKSPEHYKLGMFGSIHGAMQ